MVCGFDRTDCPRELDSRSVSTTYTHDVLTFVTCLIIIILHFQGFVSWTHIELAGHTNIRS